MKKENNSKEKKWKLKRNRVQCNTCKDIIESKYTHDWVCCSCYSRNEGNLGEGTGIFVDGGLSYQRFGWHKDGELIDLSEWEEDTEN
jgi:ssDNA-binding Zn-finger/Zn-ribbon topoisomerase 1